MLVFINLVLLVRIPGWPDSVHLFFGKSVLGVGILLHVGLSLFIIAHSNRYGELRTLRYGFYLAIHALFLVALYGSDWILESVGFDSKTLISTYGPLHGYWLGSLFVLGAYVFWLLVDTYRKSESILYRYQVLLLTWVLLLSFLIVVFFGGVLPATLGRSDLVPVGLSGLLLLYAGLSYVVNHGETLYIRHGFHRLLRRGAFRRLENLLTLKSFIRQLDELAGEFPESFGEHFHLDFGDGKRLEFLFYRIRKGTLRLC